MSISLPLCKAAQAGDLEEVKKLLRQGANVNEKDSKYVSEKYNHKVLELTVTVMGSTDGLRFMLQLKMEKMKC